MSAAVLWFRRDLRLGDHPAFLAAGEDGPVVALFVLDDALLRPSGAPRIAPTGARRASGCGERSSRHGIAFGSALAARATTSA